MEGLGDRTAVAVMALLVGPECTQKTSGVGGRGRSLPLLMVIEVELRCAVADGMIFDECRRTCPFLRAAAEG